MYKSYLNQKQASDQGKSKSRYPKPINLVDFQGLRSEKKKNKEIYLDKEFKKNKKKCYSIINICLLHNA